MAKQPMKVKVYSTDKARFVFLFVSVKMDAAGLPPQVQKMLGKLQACAEIELIAKQPRIGVDVDLALSDIERQGYHISKSRIMFSENLRALRRT
jgi:uncharacterized protein YcgL (UPF0745 family)